MKRDRSTTEFEFERNNSIPFSVGTGTGREIWRNTQHNNRAVILVRIDTASARSYHIMRV